MPEPLRASPIERVLRPFAEFAQREASSGLVLMACAVIALLWANSPWSGSYDAIWHIPFGVEIGSGGITHSLAHWINDGLMGLFFLLVGLEIKRELLVGELSSLRQASLPLFAALGGMVAPALIYWSLNQGGVGQRGWGVPMATDIAFSLGVLALLGSRVPAGLRVFVAALAIVDDIGSVLVIALFYSSNLNLAALGLAGAIFIGMMVANRMGVRSLLAYMTMATLLWLAVLNSGIHASLAGVVAALAIPSRSRIDGERFLQRSRSLLNQFEAGGDHDSDVLLNEDQDATVRKLERVIEGVGTPLQRLERVLHPLVAFGIMPLFALANAGVRLNADGISEAVRSPIALGIVVGLVLGKFVGILLFSRLAVAIGIGALPEGVGWRHVGGAAWLCGIGFTMSLFVAALAFGESTNLAAAKVGIIAASLIAGTVGSLILRSQSENRPLSP
jgi:NhaA family Na+:H+ antiporter